MIRIIRDPVIGAIKQYKCNILCIDTMMGQPSKKLAAFSFSFSAALILSCRLVWVAVSI